MKRYLSKASCSLGSPSSSCSVYPAALSGAIGQTLFPFQANGSIVRDDGRQAIGSLLIAQPFTKDEYFWPRPSAASLRRVGLGLVGLGAVQLRAARPRRAHDRADRDLQGRGQGGQAVAPDIEAWFQQDRLGGNPHIVAQWADAHNALAQAWVTGDPTHGAYIDDWAKTTSRRQGLDQGQSRHAAAAGVRPRDRVLRELLERASRQVPVGGHQDRRRRKAGHRHRAGQSRLRHPVELLRHVARRIIPTSRSATCPAIW